LESKKQEIRRRQFPEGHTKYANVVSTLLSTPGKTKQGKTKQETSQTWVY